MIATLFNSDLTLKEFLNIKDSDLDSIVYDRKHPTTAIITDFFINMLHKNNFIISSTVVKKSNYLRIIHTFKDGSMHVLEIILPSFTGYYSPDFSNIRDYINVIINNNGVYDSQIDYAFDHKIHYF